MMKTKITLAALFAMIAWCGTALALSDSSLPTKVPTTWGTTAGTTYSTCPIPIPTQSGGRASWTTGFPPVTFQPQASGGVPPDGRDFNGVLCQLSQWARWYNAGGPLPYDPTFQSAIGGYPKGSIIPSGTTFGLYWLSTADNNLSDPDTGGANWIAFSTTQQIASGVSGSSTTFSSSQCGSTVPRSNSNSLMTDSLPGTGTGVLPNGCAIKVTNTDAQALESISVQSGASFNGAVSYNGFLVLGPGQSATFTSDGLNYWVSGQPARTRLGAATTFYYSATGSNSNSGLSNSTPWLTASASYIFLQNYFDLAGQNVTLQAANGNYSGEIFNGPLLGITGPGSVIIQGNVGAPASVNYSTSSGDLFLITGGAQLTLQGFQVSSGEGSGIDAIGGGTQVNFNSFIFGVVGIHSGHVLAGEHATVTITGNYTITAGSSGTHIKASDWGLINVSATTTVTLIGTPGFVGAFAEGFSAGMIDTTGASLTWSGAASGTRYTSALNSVLYTGGAGANYFPGSVAGATSFGGQYD